MSERIALILGSTFAASFVANVAVIFAKLIHRIRPGDLGFIDTQLRIAVPAMLAVAASSWWCTRKHYFERKDFFFIAVNITLLSYPFLALIVFLFTTIYGVSSGSFAIRGYLDGLQIAMLVGGGVAMVGLIVTALPALFVEYAIVRVIRARWEPAASSEVVS